MVGKQVTRMIAALVPALALAGCGGGAPSDTASNTAASAPASAAPVSAAASVAPAPGAAPSEFAVCAVCHAVTSGQNGVGPSLFGIVGRKAASAPGYPYSDAMKQLNVTWNAASLDRWLTNPAAMAPGTKMTFPGYADPARRQKVIAYLSTLH